MNNIEPQNIDLSKIGIRKILLFLISFFFFTTLIIPKDNKDSVLIDLKTAINSKLGNEILAQVGDKKITVREFLTSYEFGPAFPKRIKNSKKHFLDYMINEKLIALNGYARGIEDSIQAKEMLNAIKGDLSTEEMFKDDILKNIKVKKSELDKAFEEKQIDYKIRWLYTSDENILLNYESGLIRSTSFDSLFNLQLNDSVFADQRSMDIDRFKLKIRNPEMFVIVDSMKTGEISKPIKANDGWYILKLDDIWKNMAATQSESAEEKADAEEAIKKEKMENESDVYVDNLLKGEKPIIKGNGFAILRSYLGGYELSKEKYEAGNWEKDLGSKLINWILKKIITAG